MPKELSWLMRILKPEDSLTLVVSMLIYFFILFKIFEFFMGPRKLTVKERNQKRILATHKEIMIMLS